MSNESKIAIVSSSSAALLRKSACSSTSTSSRSTLSSTLDPPSLEPQNSASPELPEEEYITGLEGGAMPSDNELSGIEFSPSSTSTSNDEAGGGSSSSGGGGGSSSDEGSDLSHCSSVADVKKRDTKTFEWVEQMFESVYGNGGGSGSGGQDDNEESQSKAKSNRILLIDYDIEDFDQLTTINDTTIPCLSKLLTLKVKFKIKGETHPRYDLLVIKTASEDSDSRELAKMFNAYQREVNFYGRIIPTLQAWTREQNVETFFAIPNCFYGQYHPYSSLHMNFNSKTDEFLENFPKCTESILVVQDLRVFEFGKKHFAEGLSIDEVKATICEIAKIHGISWCLQEKDGIHIRQAFEGLPKPAQISQLYLALIEPNLNKLKVYLHQKQKTPGFPPVADVLHKIRALHLKLKTVLDELLGNGKSSPSSSSSSIISPTAPKNTQPDSTLTCLLHMDLWTDNIMFRKKDMDDELPASIPSFITSELAIRKAIYPNISLTDELVVPSTALQGGGFTFDGDYVDPKIPFSVGLEEIEEDPSTSKSVPKYMEYLTDPSYANLDLLRNTTTTITEHDALGNLTTKIKILDSPLESRILDWQMTAYGKPTHDIALLLVLSLDSELRRKYTNHFLRYYYQVFEDTASTFGLHLPFDLAYIKREYQKSKLLAFLFVVGSFEMALAEAATEERLMDILKEIYQENLI